MQYTLATLEDNIGALEPSDSQIQSYLETLPKERVLNVLNKLPKNIQKEFCGSSSALAGSEMKENMPIVAVGGVVAGTLGYYAGGIGGAVVGALIGGIGGYYAKKQGII
jgi:hypothetical protein